MLCLEESKKRTRINQSQVLGPICSSQKWNLTLFITTIGLPKNKSFCLHYFKTFRKFSLLKEPSRILLCFSIFSVYWDFLLNSFWTQHFGQKYIPLITIPWCLSDFRNFFLFCWEILVVLILPLIWNLSYKIHKFVVREHTNTQYPTPYNDIMVLNKIITMFFCQYISKALKLPI